MSHLRQPRTVAWRSIEELIGLKSDFFPSAGMPDQRATAVSKVRAWSIRSRIPHSIEATCILTEAIVQDTGAASHLSLRLSYSAAVCRFVNGLLDPAQQSQFALPMAQLARDLGLPVSYVEIRHAATHEELPSLCVLRAVAVRALEWLWSNYWVTIGVESESTNTEEEAWQVTRARRLLGRWRKLRRTNPLKRLNQGGMSQDARDTQALLNECVDMCKNEDGLHAFLLALLEEKALIPAGTKKSNMMPGAFSLWTPLLKTVDRMVNGFLEALLLAMLDLFKASDKPPVDRSNASLGGLSLVLPASDETRDATNFEFVDAVQAWFEHLSSAKFCEEDSDTIDIGMLAKQCLLNLCERNLHVLHHLLAQYPQLSGTYRFLRDLAELQVVGGLKVGRKRNLADIEEEIGRYEELLREISYSPNEPKSATKKSPNAGKWTRLEGHWDARPLGVA